MIQAFQQTSCEQGVVLLEHFHRHVGCGAAAVGRHEEHEKQQLGLHEKY
jgi:hypothetical protein